MHAGAETTSESLPEGHPRFVARRVPFLARFKSARFSCNNNKVRLKIATIVSHRFSPPKEAKAALTVCHIVDQ